jgi:hypothetical protein
MLQTARPTLVSLQETKLQDIPNRLAVEFLGGQTVKLLFSSCCGGLWVLRF